MEVLYDLYHNRLVRYNIQEEVFWTAKGIELLEKDVVIENRQAA
jgi:hypothetical protein